MKQFVVYILRTSGDTLYTGQTNDLSKRLEQHHGGKVGAKYLRMFTSHELVYWEEVGGLSQALKREMEIKKMTKRFKENLIKLADDHHKTVPGKGLSKA